MTLQFRQCVAEDLDTLQAISVTTYFDTFAAVNSAENMEAYLQSAYNLPKLRRELAEENSQFYFVYADDVLAGYLKMNEAPAQVEFHDPKSLEIERLYIDKAFHGAGVGQYLMSKAVAIARERGKEYIWLGVWEHNYRAQRFYQRNGFYRIGQHAFVMGDDDQTDYLMRKDLKCGRS